MPGGERGRLVEEEELREAAGLHQRRAVPAAEAQPAGDPAPAGMVAADAAVRVVQAAAVAVDEPARRRGDQLPQRGDAILTRHARDPTTSGSVARCTPSLSSPSPRSPSPPGAPRPRTRLTARAEGHPAARRRRPPRRPPFGLRTRGLVGKIRPGCELGGPTTREAKLKAPLKGSVNYMLKNPRVVANIQVLGGAKARGVGVGAKPRAIRKAFPKAKFDHSTESVFGITLVRVPRNGGGKLQFAVSTTNHRVTSIGVPAIAFCD